MIIKACMQLYKKNYLTIDYNIWICKSLNEIKGNLELVIIWANKSGWTSTKCLILLKQIYATP